MTEGLREWAMTVCALSVFSAAVNIVIPDERCERVINLGLSALMILIVTSPLAGLAGCARHDIDTGYDASRQEEFTELVNSQAAGAVEFAAARAAEQLLEENGIIVRSVSVSTDIAENGCISIGRVAVVLDRSADVTPAAVRLLLADRMGMKNVEVTYEGGSDG